MEGAFIYGLPDVIPAERRIAREAFGLAPRGIPRLRSLRSLRSG